MLPPNKFPHGLINTNKIIMNEQNSNEQGINGYEV